MSLALDRERQPLVTFAEGVRVIKVRNVATGEESNSATEKK